MSRDKPPADQGRALAQTFFAVVMALSGDAALAADTAAPAASTAQPTAAKKPAEVVLVDINSASRAQLKTLPGIGDAEAARIIAGRPYLSKADLATRKVIPTGVYLSLKNRIVAIQKQQPKGKQ